MKIVVIVDNARLARWQVRALESLPNLAPVTVLSCSNTRIRRKPFRHALYYALNSVTVRNYWTRKVPLDRAKIAVERVVEFEAHYDGAWQRLPPHVIDDINSLGADAIVKFGMSLLRVPPGVAAPILSYHHGDPSAYRGRPAGFWETLHGCRTMGQIVQIICDRLDAGSVVAFAETKVIAHSYRLTLVESYRHSPLLLLTALRNALEGRVLERAPTGPNYRLPSNWTVVRLVVRMIRTLLRRVIYGAFYQKHWCVSTAPGSFQEIVGQGKFPPPRPWNSTTITPRHMFHADPFFSCDPPGILVEAMNRRTGKGELVLLSSSGTQHVLTEPRHHYSYPGTVSANGRTYIVPETAQWSSPQILELTGSDLVQVQVLNIENNERIVDPTIVEAADGIYLFGNKKNLGSTALCLWWSESLFGHFVEHESSPILISPAGGRMAGKVVSHQGCLYRFGQDCSSAYGDGVLLFRIEELDRHSYREVFERELRLCGVKGPHTINFGGDAVLFDWYRDEFHLLSWLTRLRSRQWTSGQ